MNGWRKLLFLVLSLAVSAASHSQCLAAGRVLVIHSYHAEYDWVQGVNTALEAQLKGASIPYRVFYMDTKRRPHAVWKTESARNARQLIASFKPEVVIAVDDNAQEFVVRHYVDKSPIQFVFAGVNADPQKYGYPSANVTGILERAYPGQVLNMLKMIVPTSLKMAWVSDDSATANLVLPRVRRKTENNELPISIEAFAQPATFDQWKATIRRYNGDPDIGALLIPLYHTVKTRANGPSVLPAEVMRWTVANTRKPVVGFWPFSTDDGAVCAVVVDPEEHGKAAGLMARQILSGKKTDDLPMLVNREGFVIINLAAAARLGIVVPFEVMISADRIIE